MKKYFKELSSGNSLFGIHLEINSDYRIHQHKNPNEVIEYHYSTTTFSISHLLNDIANLITKEGENFSIPLDVYDEQKQTVYSTYNKNSCVCQGFVVGTDREEVVNEAIILLRKLREIIEDEIEKLNDSREEIIKVCDELELEE